VTSGGRGERGDRERGCQARTGAGAWRASSLARKLSRRERVPDARAGEPERLRERPQHDHVAVLDQRDRRLAEVLEVRLVDDEGPRRRQRAHRAVGLFGRHVNVSTGSSSPTSAPASCAAMR
jgi:hypothetical protein